MSMQLVAKRYARALASSIDDNGQLEQILASLEDFAIAYDEHAELRRALENPSIPSNVREKPFREFLERVEGPEVTRSFLMTVFQRGRIAGIGNIVSSLRSVVDQRLNRTRAYVTTATELGPDQAKKIESGLKAYSQKDIQMETRVDPDILGGIVVHIDGAVIDGSLRSQLGRIRDALLNEENE